MKNIYGERLTLRGTVDKRQYRRSTRENDGKPYTRYAIRQMPNDSRPWHIMGCHVDDGYTWIVSRHANEKVATKRLEILKAKQPNRLIGPKLRHKLGLGDDNQG